MVKVFLRSGTRWCNAGQLCWLGNRAPVIEACRRPAVYVQRWTQATTALGFVSYHADRQDLSRTEMSSPYQRRDPHFQPFSLEVAVHSDAVRAAGRAKGRLQGAWPPWTMCELVLSKVIEWVLSHK